MKAPRRSNGHQASRGPRRHGRNRRSQRGAALVEFALVAPMLLVLLMGIVDFGVVVSDQISLRQGAREAARQGSVAYFGTTSTCGATFTATGSANMRKLICLTKARSDVTASSVRVAIRFDPGSTSYPAPVAGNSAPVGNGIIVCSTTPMVSLSKIFTPALGGRFVQTKVVMRIEKGSGVVESQANEADPTGQNWSWCTP